MGIKFPSPCGEKLKSGTRTLMAWQRSFRPLTGMVLTRRTGTSCRCCFRPLTGMLPKSFEEHGFVIGFSPPYGDGTCLPSSAYVNSLFSPPYGDGTTTPKYPVMDDAFPSPCGDKLKFTPLPSWLALVRFPSPCGDKLQDTDSIYCDLPPEFSFPLGDKLKCSGGDVWAAQATFPSPHGDKLK